MRYRPASGPVLAELILDKLGRDIVTDACQEEINKPFERGSNCSENRYSGALGGFGAGYFRSRLPGGPFRAFKFHDWTDRCQPPDRLDGSRLKAVPPASSFEQQA